MKKSIIILFSLLMLCACSKEDFDAYQLSNGEASYSDSALNGSGSAGKNAFKDFCVESFDTDGNGLVSRDEAAVVESIDCSGKDLTSLDGIGAFTSLKTLICDNNALTTLDLTLTPNLTSLSCKGNLISVLDIRGIALSSLHCSPMKDASGNNVLRYIWLRRGQAVADLDVPDETLLIEMP